MDYLTMTENMIIEEIINTGISSEDTILHLGAGYKEGSLLETLCEYWDLTPNDLLAGYFVGVDSSEDKISMLTKKFNSSSFIKSSFQEYMDNNSDVEFDWTILNGVFDEHLYGNNQYDYVFETIKRSLQTSNRGVILTINQNVSNSFAYSSVFIFTHLISTYSKVFVKKFEDDSYIFSILK